MPKFILLMFNKKLMVTKMALVQVIHILLEQVEVLIAYLQMAYLLLRVSALLKKTVHITSLQEVCLFL